jgi:hypothetical protein
MVKIGAMTRRKQNTWKYSKNCRSRKEKNALSLKEDVKAGM